MTTTIHLVGQRTFNKNVIASIKDTLPTAVKAKKQHVAGIGYVHYIKDITGKTLAHCFAGVQSMELLIKI